jgi:pilus assembly protein Flp/PilA
MGTLKRLFADCEGATAAEYALLIGIVGTAIAVAAFGLGQAISASMITASSTVKDCGGKC